MSCLRASRLALLSPRSPQGPRSPPPRAPVSDHPGRAGQSRIPRWSRAPLVTRAPLTPARQPGSAPKPARKQHRWSIAAVPATAMDHRCRLARGLSESHGADGISVAVGTSGSGHPEADSATGPPARPGTCIVRPASLSPSRPARHVPGSRPAPPRRRPAGRYGRLLRACLKTWYCDCTYMAAGFAGIAAGNTGIWCNV